jgi:hypothetical protein
LFHGECGGVTAVGCRLVCLCRCRLCNGSGCFTPAGFDNVRARNALATLFAARLLGLTSRSLGRLQPGKSLYTTIREFVENGLDAAEEGSRLPSVAVEVTRVPNHAISDLYGLKSKAAAAAAAAAAAPQVQPQPAAVRLGACAVPLLHPRVRSHLACRI